MKNTFVLSGVTVLLLTCLASAELIRDDIDIDFVTIGHVGNTAHTTGYGAVNYKYRIGQYEITNSQWDIFEATAGAPIGNQSGAYDESRRWLGDNVPANEVSWYEAVQFCNYLTSGDKSKGAYLWNGNNSNPGDFLGIDRTSAISKYGTIYVLPTADEWYKAAYYTGTGYSKFAFGTNDVPSWGVESNYDRAYGQPWDVSSGRQEQNGTYDMMGNITEWDETLYGADRGLRGGSYLNTWVYLGATVQIDTEPTDEAYFVGFRVASIPEPCTFLLLGLGGLLIRKQ